MTTIADVAAFADRWAATDLASLATQADTTRANADQLRAMLAELQPPDPPRAGVRRPDLVDFDRKIHAQTITRNGTVIENAYIVGRQVLGAGVKDIVFSNCVGEIAGAPPAQHDTGLILCTAAGIEGAWFEYLDLRPLTPHPYWEAAIYGRSFTAIGVRARGVIDGFALVAGPDGWVRVRTVDTLSEDHAWFAKDPAHSDGSHVDGYQIHGPGGVRVKGIELVRPIARLPVNGTAGVMCQCPGGIEQISVTRGEFYGGRATFNFGSTPSGQAAITHNVADAPVTFYVKHDTRGAPLLDIRREGNVRPDGTAANTLSRS